VESVIPSFKITDLSDGEWRDVQRLLQAPALWRFTGLVAEAGGLCPALAVHPDRDTISAALWGARIHYRKDRNRKAGKFESLQVIARELVGGTLLDVHTALRAYETFAGHRRANFPSEAVL